MSGLATIIMPFHNLAHRTLECLASLARCTTYEPVRVILIDNGSDVGQWQAVSRYIAENQALSWECYRLPENQGWVGGCIVGYEMMPPETEWVVLLNNDTVVSHGWLTRMISALETMPHYGIMGCLSVGHGGWQRIDRLQKAGWISHNVTAPSDPSQIEETAGQLRVLHGAQVREAPGMVAFFCAVLRSAMLAEIGFLDPKFGLGLGDDDDLCNRAKYNHWKIGMALDVGVWHWHRSTFQLLASSGYNWQWDQDANMAYLRAKEEGMTEMHYLGRSDGYPFIMGVPARDLHPEDMMILGEEGWTKETLARSGLYVPIEDLEVAPFCGAPTDSGEPCQRLVSQWGQRCWQHEQVMEDNNG